MAFLGMDIDQVSSHVERVRSGARRLEDAVTRLDETVARSADFWIGSDAESFRSAWASTSQELASAGRELAARGTELERHQDEQNTTSESDVRNGGPGADFPSAHDGVEKTNHPGEVPYYGEVDPEVAERWESMAPGDREKVAQAILDEQLERYGIEPVSIDFDLLDANGRWSFTENGHTIEINGEVLSNPRLLHTVAHEARHAAQWEAVQDTEPGPFDWLPFVDSTRGDHERLEEEHGFTREEIDSWRDHWNAPEDERDEYLDQSVEIDARDAGAEYSEELTEEDLARYEEEAGVS